MWDNVECSSVHTFNIHLDCHWHEYFLWFTTFRRLRICKTIHTWWWLTIQSSRYVTLTEKFEDNGIPSKVLLIINDPHVYLNILRIYSKKRNIKVAELLARWCCTKNNRGPQIFDIFHKLHIFWMEHTVFYFAVY